MNTITGKENEIYRPVPMNELKYSARDIKLNLATGRNHK
ncbi:MAG: hypothetical protein SCARUB_03767 [Candidatus Scalindua rubra]|uniref:Uncharacterized protein n=1 Tax=Candidatus Scalindua rubra TaxID=1872076 RepID=A0A1E3X697_9BACT|nr:MAG: hypothetical protein SCARUB_03767 [Candidatus Scalindua rubra]